MKELELRKHADCNKCGKKIGHTGLPLFWTAKIERHGIKPEAVHRQEALTTLLGGSSILSNIMGPNEDMTIHLMEEEVTLCEKCGTEMFMALIPDEEEDQEEDDA